MNEFKDQLDAAEKDKVEKLIGELREISAKAQSGDTSVTPEQLKAAIDATQNASLGLFQKVRLSSLLSRSLSHLTFSRCTRRSKLRTTLTTQQTSPLRRQRKRRRIKPPSYSCPFYLPFIWHTSSFELFYHVLSLLPLYYILRLLHCI